MAGNALKFIKPRARPQATDIQAAAAWGVAAFTGAVWIVQVPPSFSPNIMCLYVYICMCVCIYIGIFARFIDRLILFLNCDGNLFL